MKTGSGEILWPWFFVIIVGSQWFLQAPSLSTRTVVHVIFVIVFFLVHLVDSGPCYQCNTHVMFISGRWKRINS